MWRQYRFRVVGGVGERSHRAVIFPSVITPWEAERVLRSACDVHHVGNEYHVPASLCHTERPGAEGPTRWGVGCARGMSAFISALSAVPLEGV